MITVTVEKRYGAGGATTIRARITAPTIERAVELAGPNSRVVFPIDANAFFAPASNPGEGIDYGAMTPEGIENAYEAGLPGAYEAWVDHLKDDLGADGFELYAYQNALV